MDDESAYQNTLNYLYSFVDYSLTKADRLAQANFDLSRMVELMQRLGDPHKAYPVIHVAGTKGKGSVTAMCSSILQAAGYRTGMYTSPHLEDYAERIQVDRKPISHKELVELVERIKPHIEAIPHLTTFEITTALAFLYFQEKGVNAAVIEVGLGGRLDATNVVMPVVAVITSISYDHTFVLGETLTEIATEKCGIIKPGVAVVSAPQEAEALLVVEQIAAQKGSPLTLVGRDVFAHSVHREFTHQVVEIDFPHQRVSQAGVENTGSLQVLLPLLGDHQVENAAVAYAAIDRFRGIALPVTDEQIAQGFARTNWPGRFEILCHHPMLILDCAHNRESAHQLIETLRIMFPGRRALLIYGASEDKDIDGMFEEIFPQVDLAIFTRSFHPRAIAPQLLEQKAAPFGIDVQVVGNVGDAMHQALNQITENQVILITGSIFVVAEARHAWLNDARFKGYAKEKL
ncbi:MAG: folylpolyglutamate synthase/dihydrofolate synthase family protein [Anaerolineales bacterium]